MSPLYICGQAYPCQHMKEEHREKARSTKVVTEAYGQCHQIAPGYIQHNGMNIGVPHKSKSRETAQWIKPTQQAVRT